MNASAGIIIVDYRLGNLFSIERALRYVGAKPQITSDTQTIAEADSIVLPGVGAFADGMANLLDLGLIDPLKEHIKADKPLLGICLGMQLLLTYGEEFGKHDGLGVVPGKVVRFADDGGSIKIPHVGWGKLLVPDKTSEYHLNSSQNAESASWSGTILEGITEGSFVYFVHSFFVIPDSLTNVLAVTNVRQSDVLFSSQNGQRLRMSIPPGKER